MWLYWWLLLVALSIARGESDWSDNCPSVCWCKYSSGKKEAACSNQSLTTVPNRLSSEIQTINLSNNELHSLPSGAFSAVGLVDLHKINLRECQIQDLHENAFKGLLVLNELDLSHNRIHTLHPNTFQDNVYLRVLTMQHNPISKLDDGLFSNKLSLQSVDLTDCHIACIAPKTFHNVTVLRSLMLSGNKLAHIKVAAVESLEKLNVLVLHNNPWCCDCHLRPFHEWITEKNLIDNQLTQCIEPSHLANKRWKEITSAEFACKPQIVYPPPDKPAIVEAFGEEATLSCKVMGDPEPKAYWVINCGKITNSTGANFGGSRYTIHSGGGWVNLTIGRVQEKDRGELTCVAESVGGVDKRNVSLVVPLRSDHPNFGGEERNWLLIIGPLVVLMTLLLIVGVLCCCHCQRRRRPLPAKSDAPNGDITHQDISILTVVNPVQKPPRRCDELNHNLLDDTGTSVGPDFEERSKESVSTTPNLGEGPHYLQDLLAFPHGLRSSPDITSPVHGTLPYSRSQSPFSPTRPWYVTIPRHLIVPNWSIAPTPTLLEDPLGHLKVELAYDNLGLRTTANGSSLLSLNKSLIEPQPRPRPLPQYCSTLPTPHRPRMAPEGAPLSLATSVEGPLSPSKPKVPPQPPSKPKKNDPLYEDEGEDGTEV